MPKNENEEVYCINKHDDQTSMTKDSDPAILLSATKEEGQEKRTLKLGQGNPVRVYTCPKCGYTELYEFKNL
ncbi:hypothetical protein ACMGDK_11705 [Chryseobacterium sp. DT-3]|uniref:hypothetical protein n=1 Tax=Chryseobacterium sp. DT-3 TaxID=3396164 RepID=UPI003F1A3988